jgi:hypothetical protein
VSICIYSGKNCDCQRRPLCSATIDDMKKTIDKDKHELRLRFDRIVYLEQQLLQKGGSL